MTRIEPGYVYGDLFYGYQRDGSARSAAAVVPQLLRALPIHSVLDIGCGAGAWLREYRRAGVDEVVGVDGDYVNRDLLLFDRQHFCPQDITEEFRFNRSFGLVQCIEVAEHIPASSSAALIRNIVSHGDIALFSAAVPGQGGENHINEQSMEFWRSLFAAEGFDAYDFVRALIAGNKSVESWYRYNLLLYVRRSAASSLPAPVLATRVAADRPIADVSPLIYRMRKAVLRRLPADVVSRLAIIKHRIISQRQPLGH